MNKDLKKEATVHPWYRNRDGRVFRGTKVLAKHTAKMGLVPCDPPKGAQEKAKPADKSAGQQ